jgi:CheY-like chemotaxis protein
MSMYTKILLVEDDKDDQQFFIETLPAIDASLTWVVADNGVEAFRTLEKLLPQMPDLIFLDLNMPRMSGFEFMQHMQGDTRYQQFKHIPIIVLTTSAIEREKCYALGACVCLDKPLDLKAYRTMLITVLDSDVVKHKAHLRHLFGE